MSVAILRVLTSCQARVWQCQIRIQILAKDGRSKLREFYAWQISIQKSPTRFKRSVLSSQTTSRHRPSDAPTHLGSFLPILVTRCAESHLPYISAVCLEASTHAGPSQPLDHPTTIAYGTRYWHGHSISLDPPTTLAFVPGITVKLTVYSHNW